MGTNTVILGSTDQTGSPATPRVLVDSAGRIITSPGGAVAVTGLNPSGLAQTLSVSADGALTGAYVSIASITRPANTTAYTAGDVVGPTTSAVLNFAVAGPAAGHVFVTTVSLEIDVTAIPTGMGSFRLHLYNGSPTSALADNAAWDLAANDRPNYLGYVDVGSPADLGSTLYTQVDATKQIKLGAGTTLYGYLQTLGGYTPAANSEVYVVVIHTLAA